MRRLIPLSCLYGEHEAIQSATLSKDNKVRLLTPVLFWCMLNESKSNCALINDNSFGW